MKAMKKLLALTLALAMVLSLAATPAFAAEGYTDVAEGKWYYEEVQYVTEQGLMNGMNATEFGPMTAVSRAMVVTTLWRMEGEPAPKSETTSFDDLKQDWYKKAVAWASENGIVEGRDPKTFDPATSITRQELAIMFYNYCVTFKGVDGSVEGDMSVFTDIATLSTWAKDQMVWAVGAGMINGLDAKTLGARGTANRAQLATMLQRINEDIVAEGVELNPIEVNAASDLYALEAGANDEAYYAVSSRLNGQILTVVPVEGVTVTVNGVEVKDSIELTGTPVNKVVVTNTTDKAVSLVATIAFPEGTEANPIVVNSANELTGVSAAAKGETYYAINSQLNGMILTVAEAEGVTVTVNGKEIEGSVELTGTPVNKVVVKNSTDKAVELKASIAPKAEQPEDPSVEPDEPTMHVHAWDAGNATTPATCEKDGVMTYTCACTETKTEVIPATGHTFVWGACECGETATQLMVTGSGYQYDAVVTANDSAYYQGRVGGMTLTIENAADATVVCDGKTYTAVDGVITVEIAPSMDFFNPPIFCVTSTKDATYTMTFTIPVGSRENPATLVVGENKATVKAGSQGYFYTYTAEADCILTIEMADENWSYTVNNMASEAYGDETYGEQQWSDSDPVISTVDVNLKKGEELQLIVNTYDPENEFEAPAGTVTVNVTVENLLSLGDNNFEGAMGMQPWTQKWIAAEDGTLTVTVTQIAFLNPETNEYDFQHTGMVFGMGNANLFVNEEQVWYSPSTQIEVKAGDEVAVAVKSMSGNFKGVVNLVFELPEPETSEGTITSVDGSEAYNRYNKAKPYTAEGDGLLIIKLTEVDPGYKMMVSDANTQDVLLGEVGGSADAEYAVPVSEGQKLAINLAPATYYDFMDYADPAAGELKYEFIFQPAVTTVDALVEAIEAGGVVALGEDVELEEAVKIEKPVTIIGVGEGVTITSDVTDLFEVVEGGELTLGENVTVETTDSILYANGGIVNVEGAALKSASTQNALGFASNGGTINMTSGSVEAYWTGLTASGEGSSVNVYDGTVESTNSNAVLAKNGATATISGGSVKTGEFVTLWAKDNGKLVVTGGTITTGNDAISLESGATATVTGGVFNTMDVLNHLGQYADVTVSLTEDVTLTGVTTISENVTINAVEPVVITTEAVDALTVTGTLNLGENVTVEAADALLYANGGTVNVNGAVLESTGTVNALGYADNGGSINVNYGSVKSSWTGLTASGEDSSVNVYDGTVESTNSNAVLAKNGATATISGGTVKTGEFVTLWAKDNGKLVVSGGTIVTGNDAISLESGATADVTGGTFNVDVSDYVAEGYAALENEGVYTVYMNGAYENPIVLTGDCTVAPEGEMYFVTELGGCTLNISSEMSFGVTFGGEYYSCYDEEWNLVDVQIELPELAEGETNSFCVSAYYGVDVVITVVE